MRSSVIGGAFLHAALLSVVALGVSVPLIFLLHAHFELGEPSRIGLVSLCIGVVGVIVGASLLGVWLGLVRGLRASGASAAFTGFLWGFILSVGLCLSYSRQVGALAIKQASAQALENRQLVEGEAHEVFEQSRAGHASKEATLSALSLSDSATEATISATAKLPSMGLLIWTVLLPPLLCAFECSRARE